MPSLDQIYLNHCVEVVRLTMDESSQRDLTNLGLIPGCPVSLLSTRSQIAVLQLKEKRISIDRDFLKQIQVKELDTRNFTNISLDQVSVGSLTIVVAINGTGPINRRLMDMGITKGTPIRLIKKAPLGDPLEIKLRGYTLTLRKDEAQSVLVLKEVFS
ncbi:ferrous iron transport protein A [Vaginisenegalia massiliensis]|uniref:ferrous iron transport protein A n=1 Tax=Vaginisenegalia massiliensis TaxID=2058294 RepID=UPI000F541667|nr:ferrous iron transport protein A [Vaginisenegalia massiliensis]